MADGYASPTCILLSTAANRSAAAASRVANETSTPTANDSGIVTSAGFLSGNHAPVCFRMSTWMVGESQISTSVDSVPTTMLETIPSVVQRRQKMESTSAG